MSQLTSESTHLIPHACALVDCSHPRRRLGPILGRGRAEPEPGYGWEKLFTEELCRYYQKDYKFKTRMVRFHNVYGPLGTYEGGKEKAPAAICRKVALLTWQEPRRLWKRYLLNNPEFALSIGLQLVGLRNYKIPQPEPGRGLASRAA